MWEKLSRNRTLFLAATHLGALGLGFALGVSISPILTAPKGPDAALIAEAAAEAAADARVAGRFVREREGRDLLHWGEGEVMLSSTRSVHDGALSPRPDYRLYRANALVETEAQFVAI